MSKLELDKFLVVFDKKRKYGFIPSSHYASRARALETVYRFCYNESLPSIIGTEIGSINKLRFIVSTSLKKRGET